MKFWLFSILASALAIGPVSDLADIGPSPSVELTDAEGRPFSLASLEGKVVLVSFIYTTCNGSCPLTTATLDRVRRALREEGLWGQSVEFVSITLDPARDTFARQLTGRGYRPAASIVAARFGPDAGLIGAAALGAEEQV